MPRFDTGVGARQAAGDRGNTDDTVIRRRKAAVAGIWATSEAKQQLQRCEGGKVQVTPSAPCSPLSYLAHFLCGANVGAGQR